MIFCLAVSKFIVFAICITSCISFVDILMLVSPLFQTDPDFDLDIRDDVQDECSKFGAVKHIFVDK